MKNRYKTSVKKRNDNKLRIESDERKPYGQKLELQIKQKGQIERLEKNRKPITELAVKLGEKD